MRTITDDQVKQVMREVVEEYGQDYVYQKREDGRCVYVHEGKPDCFVAVVLHRLGVTIEQLGNYGDIDGEPANGLIYVLRFEGIINLSYQAQDALHAVQVRQDNAIPWGAACERGMRLFDKTVV